MNVQIVIVDSQGNSASQLISIPVKTNYPDATTTGVPTGSVLTNQSGRLTVTTPNTIISNKHFLSDVVISANNVTIQNSLLDAGGYFPITVTDGYTGAVIQDCEINGGSFGQQGIRGSNMTVLRCNIHHIENGIDPGSNVIIRDCYIHDLTATSPPRAANQVPGHFDGIEHFGGTNVLVDHCTILLPSDTGCYNGTSQFGNITATIQNSKLRGGTYNIYADATQGVKGTVNLTVTNCRLGGAQYGYFYINGIGASINHSQNINDDTGLAID